MLKILNITLNVIVFVIIFNQFMILTKMSYNYNYYYDYGKKLKEVCSKENVEYETNRYQLNNNVNNIEITNNNNNIILALSIIFTITISVIFTLIFVNEFCKLNKSFMLYNLISKTYIVVMIIIALCILLYPILLVLFKILNIKYDNVISLYNHNINKKNLYTVIAIFGVLIIFRLFSIINKFNVPDFELSNDNINKRFVELFYFIFYCFIYFATIYYITNILILYKYKINNFIVDKHEFDINKSLTNQYLKKLLGVSEHKKFIEKIEYKKKIDLDENKEVITKNENLPTNLNNYNNIPTDYIDDIINNIDNVLKKNIENYEISSDIRNLIIKSIKDYITIKLNSNNKDSKEHVSELYDIILKNSIIESNVNSEIISSIIAQKISKSIDELNMKIDNNNKIKDEKNIKATDNEEYEIYISDTKSIFKKNIEGLLFIIGIFLISIFVVNFGLSFNYKQLSLRIKYNIIIPILSLYLIILILISNDSFNKMINYYIIENPKFIYKNNINDVNKNFNKILANEFYIYENINNTLCINAKNSFVSSINNLLFNISIVYEQIYIISPNPIIPFPDELKKYKDSCTNNNKTIDYNLQTNLDQTFYNIDDCSILCDNKIKKLIYNTVIYDLNSVELKQLFDDIKVATFGNSIENTILNDIIYKYEKYENIKVMIIKIKEKLSNLLKNTLYNVIILNKSYNKVDKYVERDITYLNITDYRNYCSVDNTNSELKKYNYMIDNIVTEYLNMLLINQYLLSKLVSDSNLSLEVIFYDYLGNTEKLNNNFELKKNIVTYVNSFIELYNKFLIKLDLIFKNKYNLNNKTNRISLYLINIYNNINKENPYYDDIIYPYNENEHNVDYKNMMSNFNKNLTTIINDYDKLKIICNKNNYQECDIDNLNYDKNILVKEIEDIIRLNKLNISNLINYITNITDKTKNYFDDKYDKSDTKLTDYNNFTHILTTINNDLGIINNKYVSLINEYYNEINVSKNIYKIKEQGEDLFNSNLNNLKTTIYTSFYRNAVDGEPPISEAILKSNNKTLIKCRDIINHILKNLDIKKENKIFQEKDNVINLNKKINEVNYTLIYLIIIYIIIIFLIKYIK